MPHLSDYWQVVARRFPLLLVVLLVTTGASAWAVSRQQPQYRSTMSLLVNDPLARQRGLVVSGSRVSNMDIYVDPIESEIQVLSSSSIALAVIDSLGLRLRRIPAEAPRSALFRDAWVSPEAPSGSYRLVYAPGGRSAEFQGSDGASMGAAEVGSILDAGTVVFLLQPAPEEETRYELEIVPASHVIPELTLSATPRESTNIIDVSLLHGDPVLAPRILEGAGTALRDKGADRVRAAATDDLVFIREQLDSADRKLRASRDAIRDFKTSQAFTTLTVREQSLVSQSQRLDQEIEAWSDEREALTDLVVTLQTEGVDQADLPSLLAGLPEEAGARIQALVDQIRAKQAEERALLIEDRKSAGHPEVLAVRTETAALGRQLGEAADATLRVIEARLAALYAEEEDLLVQQAQFPELESRLSDLEAQSDIDRESYQFLLSQLYQAGITQAAASPYVEILDTPSEVVSVETRGSTSIGLGALLGLILGIGAAFFLEYLDRTVRTSAEIESLLGIPVLSVIPRLRSAGASADPVIVAMDPLDPAAEAFRNLRLSLAFMGADERPIRSVVFSSPGPSEGKSTVAVNFAIMVARQGQRVLLVDADLRRPTLHRALDTTREPGLTNLLIGDSDLDSAVRAAVFPNLDFLPSGPFPPNPSELLGSKRMGELLRTLGERYDQIVIDSPPTLAVTDAMILATHADGVVLVFRAGETEQRAADRSLDQVRRLDVQVFGGVLNEYEPHRPGDDDYLHYIYRYHEREDDRAAPLNRLRRGLATLIAPR